MDNRQKKTASAAGTGQSRKRRVSHYHPHTSTPAGYSQAVRPMSEVIRPMAATAARNGWHVIVTSLATLTGNN